MRIIEWCVDFFQKEAVWSVVICMIAGLFLLLAAISYGCKDTRIYVAFSAVVFGGLGIFTPFFGIAKEVAWAGVSLLLVFGGSVYLLLFGMILRRERVAKRKKMQAETAKRVEYALPQRENAYIRARLQDGLRVENEVKTTQVRARLGYVRALLGKVKSAPLSIAERLQAEEMEKILSLYRGKTVWTVEELRGMNDMCAALLKLSAKYTV